MRFRLSFFIFIFLFLFFITSKVQALGADIGISPSLIEKDLAKGQEITEEIEVFNNSELNLSISGAAKQFNYPKRKTPNQKLNEVNPGDWIIFGEPEFILEAKKSKKIPVTIRVPKNAQAGSYDFLIGFSPENNKEANSINIVGRINTILLVNVEGKVNYLAQLEKYFTNQKIYLIANSMIQFSYTIYNQGDSYIQPQSQIIVKNILSGKNQVIDANQEKNRVLVGEEREILTNWQPKYLLGFYKANLKVDYLQGKTLVGNTSFWVIPLREIGIALIILFMLGIRFLQKKSK